MEEIEELRGMIKNSDKIVFFGGAGVSTAVGLSARDYSQPQLFHEKDGGIL